MTPAPLKAKSLKLRRRGRHAAPTKVEKIAGKATSAAPAVVIAGSVIAAPAAAHAATTHHAAVSVPATAAAAAHAAHLSHSAHVAHTAHLARVAARNAQAAQAARAAHAAHLAHLAHLSHPSAPAAPAATEASSVHGASASYQSHASGGTLGCSGLESLWQEAGGQASEAFMAAEIAMAESGGNQYAHSPTDDYGYWQINGSHGPSMATYDPVGNARAAISISSDGTDWSQWSTYTSGAYQGKC